MGDRKDAGNDNSSQVLTLGAYPSLCLCHCGHFGLGKRKEVVVLALRTHTIQ